ncbi:hypothetical protein [Streptacidiphilus jiangxiensis]|uniref:hypothetical protein n=1 Tax=Streptacidiphilus jiangxiensis TaxID=235985 RepID=UPI001160274E|nr:hypothetical protein [Streptacidiphilus jiangxiensis]
MPERSELPSRAEVARVWRGVIDGSVAREEGHAWAAAWVEGAEFNPDDAAISMGLQYLHGFDLVVDEHGGMNHSFSGASGNYVKEDQEVEADLRHWLHETAMYDEDGPGYLARKVAHALEVLEREGRGGAPRHSDPPVPDDS